MKKSNIIFVLILLIVLVIAVAVLTNLILTDNNPNALNIIESTNIDVNYSKILSNHSKINISSQLSEDKIFNNLIFNNIKLVENDGIATLSGIIKNNSSTTQKSGYFTCHMLNDDGSMIYLDNGELYILTIYLNKDLEPNGIAPFEASITSTNIDIYNFDISSFSDI